MSTIKVNNIVPPNAGEGVSIDGLQMPTAGAFSNRNLIINGAMQVAQRGISSTSDGGYHTVDRWRSTLSSGTGTQSQLTLSSGSPYDEGFRKAYRMQITSASASTSAYAQLQTRLEAQDIAQSGWKYKDPNHSLTCSFWARSSLAGTYTVQYRASDVGDFFFNRTFTVTANTWTKVTHTIPGHASLVFNNDNDLGMQVVITPYYGPYYTGSSAINNAWFTLSGTDYFPDYAQAFSNTANATFDVTGVQLEVGSKATPFEHRTFGDELARCQRYYYQNQRLHGIWTAGQTMRFTAPFHTTMRTAPTLAVIDSNGYHEYWNLIGYAGVSNIPVSAGNEDGADFQINSNANQSRNYGDPAMLNYNIVSFSAEL
jgi:hypothetical protein